MCDETSSSEWALEKKKFNLAPSMVNNIDGLQDTNSTHVIKITEDKIDALKNVELLKHLTRVCFTGGEPLIIKEYYDYMDFLIDNGLNTQTDIELFTNCSVYNPLFVDRLNKFKHVELTMSIDGVGKTAEYIRHGMSWETIKKNVLTFNSLPSPIKLYVNVAISAYTLLDVSSLAKFLMELYSTNPTIGIKCYTVLMPGLRFQAAPLHLQKIMLAQIDEAIETLTVPNYDIFRNELINLRNTLITWK
jgi:sulfatase maturation enzyme AslB (radical SAM superfamily)